MNNHPLQAANQVICESDNTAIQKRKPAPKKHRARVYMLRTGVNGFTENEILRYFGRSHDKTVNRIESLDYPAAF